MKPQEPGARAGWRDGVGPGTAGGRVLRLNSLGGEGSKGEGRGDILSNRALIILTPAIRQNDNLFTQMIVI